MTFFRISIKFLSFSFFLFRFRDWKLAYLFAHYHIPLKSGLTLSRSGSYLLFKNTGNRIPIKQSYVYREEIRSLIAVLNDKHVKVVKVDNGSEYLRLSIGGVFLQVHSVSNMFTAYEIFLEKLYDFSTSGPENVVIDIGMNVGYASLFFAACEHVEHVYSFEPFPETYMEATNNLALNPKLLPKVTPYNLGISNRNTTLDVPRLEGGSAIASTSAVMLGYIESEVKSNGTVVVEVRNITDVAEEVVSKHPQSRIFLKVDCEGEEYAIFDELDGKPVLQKLSGFFVEWHLLGPEKIVKVLNANGYTTLHLPRIGTNSGMIYAFR